MFFVFSVVECPRGRDHHNIYPCWLNVDKTRENEQQTNTTHLMLSPAKVFSNKWSTIIKHVMLNPAKRSFLTHGVLLTPHTSI